MKYAVLTFGCRVNQADSLVIERELRRRGATGTVVEDADLVVVNTCSVTASADQGARQTIRRIAKANPGVKVVVTGCYATRRPGELRAVARSSPESPDGQPSRCVFRPAARNRRPGGVLAQDRAAFPPAAPAWQ